MPNVPISNSELDSRCISWTLGVGCWMLF
jgi:hypothetical protein